MLTPFLNAWRGIDGWIRWTLMLLGAPLVIVGVTYWGYCWGWWGRNTLALQYLFQCRCPQASEAVRYRPFTVLVSACRNPRSLTLSPDRQQLLFIAQQRQSMEYHVHLRDLITGQERDLGSDITPHTQFIDDNHLLWSYGSTPDQQQYVLLDLRTSQTTQLSSTLAPYFEGETLSPQALMVFQQADTVLVMLREFVALRTTENHALQIGSVVYANDHSHFKQTMQMLEGMGVKLTSLLPSTITNSVEEARYTQDGRLWATDVGIFSATSPNPIITTGFPPRRRLTGFFVIGWARGDQAVIYEGNDVYVIDGGPSAIVIPTRFFPVPQPILLLEVPPAGRE